jgi:hypothetical protein
MRGRAGNAVISPIPGAGDHSAADELGDRLKYLADQLSTNHRAKRVPFGRSLPCRTEFIFLGAVIGKYTFGFADGSDESSPRGLRTIVSEGRAVRYVDAEDAFADLSHTLHTRQHSQSV